MASNVRLPGAMKVLVTGGTGVVGRSTVTALLKRGHSVRLLSRHADSDVRQWPGGVEPWPGDVASAASIAGSAEGCDVVVHLVAIVSEHPPERTFQRVNVDGTRHLVEEAERAGVRRFVYVSSLGCDSGKSGYHQSKLSGEQLARTFSREWVIVRPGAVYGPGDEHLSVMLRMVRTLPVIPSIGDGSQRFQPVWHEDLAAGLAASAERPGLESRVLEVGGVEVLTQGELVDRLQAITDRRVPTLPIPEFLASLGMKAMEAAGVEAPLSDSQLDMLREENIIPPGRSNALIDDLGITPTPLDEGLERFVNEQAEQLPDEGVGTLRKKTFSVEVSPSSYDADRLFSYLKEHLMALMPSLIDSDPELSNPSRIVAGDTLTLALPMRGHIQVRVAEVADRRITLMTLEGHPLAGAVRFVTKPVAGGVGFEIQVYDRPANVIDWLLMRPIGDRLQEATWTELVRSVASVAGDDQAKVAHTVVDLSDDEAEAVEKWARDLANARHRAAASAEIGAAEVNARL